MQKLPSKRSLAHHDTVMADESRDGRLLARASAIILCVRIGIISTKLALIYWRTTSANVDVVRKFAAHWGFTHFNTYQIVLENFS